MIGVLGINHKTAPLEIREHFAISKDEISGFAELLQKQANFSDIVVLSTCNRTEIYFSQNQHNEQIANTLLFNTLMIFKVIDFDAEKYFYNYHNEDAINHLFQVTSGIDSMVIGEDQIIGQVKDAYVTCTELALTDAVLMRLFQKSFEVGKKVRTQTSIKSGSSSVSLLAANVCEKEIKNLSNKIVFMIGTGETGALTLQNLQKKGVKNFLISNRTKTNAEPFICQYNSEFIALEDIEKNLHKADVIITATSSKEPIISKKMVANSILERNGEHQFYVDLSVPRNIEYFKNVCGANLIAVDDLQSVMHTQKQNDCVERGSHIINESVDEFIEWVSFRNLKPAIRSINFHLEKIFINELNLYSKELSEEDRKTVQNFNEHLIQKYSRKIVTNLKEVTENGKKEQYLKIINELFNK